MADKSTTDEDKDKATTDEAPKAKVPAKQVASVGRMVHFVNGDQHVPAVITDPEAHYHAAKPDGPGVVAATGQALTVFPVGGAPFTTVAVEDADGAPATWHWPEHVPAK